MEMMVSIHRTGASHLCAGHWRYVNHVDVKDQIQRLGLDTSPVFIGLGGIEVDGGLHIVQVIVCSVRFYTAGDKRDGSQCVRAPENNCTVVHVMKG